MLQASFFLAGRSHQVSLDASGISWQPENCEHSACHVPTCEILSCWPCPKGSINCCSLVSPSTNDKSLANDKTGLRQSNHPSYTSINPPPAIKPAEDETVHTPTQTGDSPHDDSFQNAPRQESRSLSPASATNESTTISLSPSAVAVSAGTISANNSGPQALDHPCSKPHQVVPAPLPSAKLAYQYEPPERSGEMEEASSHFAPHTPSYYECRHTSKSNQFPGLTVEICDRVRPETSRFNCFSGDRDENATVTEWAPLVLVFHHMSKDVVKTWFDAIWATIRGSRDRPVNLMIIINPFGGRKKAEDIYNKVVAPLLQRAVINTTVHKTTHSGHAETLAAEAASDASVAGVVAVGGDGLAAEVVHGLVLATVTRAGLNEHDPRAALPVTKIRLGVIPAGSTDAYIYSLQGTRDVVTHALQIIMGSRRCVDVAGLYSAGRLERFVMAALHVGWLGGIQETGIKLRHLGPVRDTFGLIKEAVLNRSYSCSLRMRTLEPQLGSPFDDIGCSSKCNVCSDSSSRSSACEQAETWVKLEGEYNSISCTMFSLECDYVKHGIAPAAHAADGTADIIILPKCSHFTLLRHLMRMLLSKKYLRHAPLQVVRASEVQFKSQSSKTPLSFDGELRYDTELTFIVHRQRLQVFSRGRERQCAGAL